MPAHNFFPHMEKVPFIREVKVAGYCFLSWPLQMPKKIIWLHNLPSFPPPLSTECIYVSKMEVRSNTVNSLLTDTSIRWTPFLEWTPKECACLSLLPLFTLHKTDVSVRQTLGCPKGVGHRGSCPGILLCSALILYPNLLFTKLKARSAQIRFVHVIA